MKNIDLTNPCNDKFFAKMGFHFEEKCTFYTLQLHSFTTTHITLILHRFISKFSIKIKTTFLQLKLTSSPADKKNIRSTLTAN